MKKPSRNLTAILGALSLALLSSCNRGYGCPNNFSLNDALSSFVDAVITVINYI